MENIRSDAMTTTTVKTTVRARQRRLRSERVQARLTTPVKQVIEQAADICGLSVSDFMVNSSRERAEVLIREHRVITLTAEDSMAFATAIVNPPPPDEALRALFAEPRVAQGDM